MKRCKALAYLVSAVAGIALFTGCNAEPTTYELHNSEGYTVSVRYDANGGEFTTGTSVIVDSFDVSTAPKDTSGNASIALLDPLDASRIGTEMTPKEDHFLVGWYQECLKEVDADGNETVTYSKRWDFENDVLPVDPNGSYSSDQPVMTLYAAWAPKFQIEIRERGTDFVQTVAINPNEVAELKTPSWDTETGKLRMYNLPERDGYTLKTLYLDAEGTRPLTGETFAHTGVIDYETATVENTLMTLYADYEEGEWYRIYTAEQLKDNASINGSYEIMADLDFADEIWPTSLMRGNFAGTIRGNGHTIANVTFEQTDNDKTAYGLFGNLTENATVTDVTFDKVCFTVKKGVKLVDTCIGLFAGKISSGATVENVAVTNSVLQMDSSVFFFTEEYSIGLVCGSGDATLVDPAQITVKAVGDDPDALKVTINGNSVTIGG